jgi:DNA processing protein
MITRKLLLKIKLSHGIGIKREYQFYQWLVRTFEQVPQQLDISAEKIAAVLMLPKNVTNIFINSFNSDKLNNELSYHLKYVDWISILDDDYPMQLKESYLPPIVFFYSGNLSLLKQRLLGIVGSRKCSDYSLASLKILLPDVIKHNVTVVSGLARGVDKLSHQGAIANQGQTIAVIGTGLDKYYPKENESLQKQIAKNHLLISEYPVGSQPARYHFPERNRIIAGLVKSILVTEAKEKSGSLITVNLALQNNRNVMALPGRIDSNLSLGCNKLILAGAKPVVTAKDILEEFIY